MFCLHGFPHLKAYGLITAVCLFLVLGVGIFIPVEAAETTDLTNLLDRAHAQNLHRDRYWQILLHYKPYDTESQKSLIDDPTFFLAPHGKTNPSDELEATLRGLFREELAGDEAIACRFPARTEWLRSSLGIDDKHLPKFQCRKLEEALASADPKRTVLVFPSAHINSPASMFGHTLLRIDNSYRSELLAYSVSYAAVTTETNGAAYAFKGIFGLYPGRYSVSPYYEKVKEYNDIEHRDIWEYHLNLTEAETRRMVLHVWEVQGTFSDYYFFDENCSYNILFCLEAARPTINLTAHYSLWVIPSDTVRLVRRQELVSSVRYRPSQGTRIRHLSSLMNRNDQETARDIAYGETTPASLRQSSRPQPNQGRILELAAEVIQYRYSRQELEKNDYTQKFHAILKERSSLGESAGSAPPIPEPTPPDEGHGTARAGVAIGARHGHFFTELSGRFAYHDTMDPDNGYIKGAQINFFDTVVRAYPGDGQVQLQRLHFIDILSLSPRDLMFTPFSWKVNTGFDQEVMSDGNEHLLYRLNTGAGLTWDIHGLGLLFLMAETDLNFAGKLDDKFAAGVGGSAGLVGNVTSFWKVGLTLSGFYYPVFQEHSRLQAVLSQNFRISRNNSIAVSLKEERTFGYERYEVKAGWNVYF